MALFSTAVIKQPTKYEEAMNCERKEDKIVWREVTAKELSSMVKGMFGKLLMEKIFQVINN
jgi:hypothetical protein